MSGEKKMMAPTTTLWWIDRDALTTPSTPSVADLTAALAASPATALNFSAATAAGYTLNPQASDTISAPTIVDRGQAQARGSANYEGLLPFYMERDPATNTESVYLAAYDFFKEKDRLGYVLRRLGKEYTEAAAAGDIVDVFLFLTALPRVQDPDNNSGAYQFQVPLLKQGFVKTNVAMVA